MKKILILSCFISGGLLSQTAGQCKNRFNTYLNFRGTLDGAVKFESDGIFIMNGGSKEFAIYSEEISMMADFFENSTVKQQEQLMRFKRLRKFSQRERDSIAISTDSKKIPAPLANALPLHGIRIAIDPGHFGTTLKEAQVEQKFLYFPDQRSTKDTVKLFESSLTFNTASILKQMLVSQGASVFLSRDQSNYTSFNCSFYDWMQKHKSRTLDSLVKADVMTAARKQQILKFNDYKFFWDFFRDFDLANRAKKINNFDPHFTVIIHYNVDEKNVPWKSHTKKNFSMTFIAGGMTGNDLGKAENKMHFLRLLLTNQLERSELLAKETVNNFNKVLGIPIAGSNDATYLRDNCIATRSKGVFCRNLVLCRKINSPLVYGESLYQDNENETVLLMKSDLDLYGIKTNERLKKVAESYYEAVLSYVNEQRLIR